MSTGKVKWFNEQKGFGFITPNDGSQDLFVHHSEIMTDGFHVLNENQEGLEEIYRVLKEEGRFFLCDFCSPQILTFPLMYLMLIWISSTRYQLFGKLPELIRECKFKTVELKKRGAFLEYYLITKN